jgi:hypothetical protein
MTTLPRRPSVPEPAWSHRATGAVSPQGPNHRPAHPLIRSQDASPPHTTPWEVADALHGQLPPPPFSLPGTPRRDTIPIVGVGQRFSPTDF